MPIVGDYLPLLEGTRRVLAVSPYFEVCFICQLLHAQLHGKALAAWVVLGVPVRRLVDIES